jgi:hypothetical protein
MFINVLAIWIFVMEPIKHTQQGTIDLLQQFSFTREVIMLFALTLFATIGLASIQSMSAQYYKDVFGFSAQDI